MIERFIIGFGLVFGLVSFPTLFKKPDGIWLPLYLLNCIVNYIFDKILVKKNKIKYPVRFLPKFFEINVVYDFLVCPFLSVWFCRSTYHSNLNGIIGKLLLFGIPQGIYEILLEKKTGTLEFKGKWKWYYSAYLVFIVKLLSRGTLEILKKMMDDNNLS